jgi:2-amino-4-hydroxy-6-hydroxymethyldihydropteridine diphosphokinase
MSNRSTVVVGLGANLGAREQTLRSAVRELERLTLPGGPFRVSSLYESEPLGPPQPRYLNAAVLLSTGLEPLALLDELQAIETAHGRVRRERWGARTLDLDLLWREEGEVTLSRLRVPHPELEHRLFALLPLLDVAPGACRPGGAPWRVVAARLDPAGLTRIAGPEWAASATGL